MNINYKVLIIISIIFSIIASIYYSDELAMLLIPILVILKVKLIFYFNAFISIIVTFWGSSKGKLFAFFKGLTIYKALIIGIKRFILDTYFSKWLSNNVIDPVKEPVIGYIKFFFKLGLKTKLKRITYFIFPMVVVTIIAQMAGILESILLLAELKALIAGFFKILWVVVAKVISYFSTVFILIFESTWIITVLEIFALSWLLTKLESIPYIGIHIVRFFNYIGDKIGIFFGFFIRLYNRYIYTHISLRIKKKMDKFSVSLVNFLENTKHENEVFILKHFINDFVKDNSFEDYYSNINFKKLSNKNEIYRLINKKTKDNIDIKYYFNIDVNSIHKDVLIIESVASCIDSGNINSIINKNSFWVLNLSDKDIFIYSENDNFIIRQIKSKKIKLIHSLKQDFSSITVDYGGSLLPVNTVYMPVEKKKTKKIINN